MSRVYYIRDARGERELTEADLPLAVGGEGRGDVVIAGVGHDSVLAYIALSDGHAYIQPGGDAVELYHNHERFSDSRWLKSGDHIQAGDSMLHWMVQGDQVVISVQRHVLPEQTTPPLQPPPAPPAAGRPLPVVDNAARSGRKRGRTVRGLAILFLLLVLAAVFVLVATPVAVSISPLPESQSLQGFPPPVTIGNRQMVLPGRYTVRAMREGYRPLEEAIVVRRDGFQEFAFELQELPGRVGITVTPAAPFRLFSAEQELAVDPTGIAEIDRGMHQLRVVTERYLPAELSLEVEGFGRSQSVDVALQPGWADLRLDSKPAGAEVSIDDERVGVTPLQTEILHGPRNVTLTLERYKTASLQLDIEAGSVLEPDAIQLQPADGQLVLGSQPADATISVDGEFRGTTPATLMLASGTEHRLRLSKPGYQTFSKDVTLAPGAIDDLDVNLTPQYGVVFLTTRPADASLQIDGRPAGKSTQRLRLTTRSHTLEVSKPGYTTRRVTITPRAGVSQNVDVELKTVAESRAAATPAKLTTKAGQTLKLVRPGGSFRMGASRREAGRRANESARLVQLTRAFYLGTKEVTNGEFRRFRASHSSGSAEGAGLDADDQPVANISWDDAARYCNWLSQKEGRPEAYREAGGRMVAVSPMPVGYRLPTEAEWSYVARMLGRQDPSRYPWAGSYPPTSLAGNFADAQIADTLAHVVPGYDDKYRGSAPVGRFAAQPDGFYDLGGNVAEWIHDYYAVYPGMADRLVSDPSGPDSGDHHVVRGSSWRNGSISELRLSYRDYSRGPRPDLGFRIARYAE
jgi:formylglycine-generating enzyme required for sulfatase activity